jgi:hypothetical protein
MDSHKEVHVMRVTPLRATHIVLLVVALVFVSYPFVHHVAHAQTAQPPLTRARRPTPTPTPTRRSGNQNPDQNPDQTNTPTPTPTPTPRSGGHGGRNTAIGVGIGAGIAAAIIATHGGGEADKLSKNGPKFESRWNMSKFAVKGFARGGWPVVVAYEVLDEPAVVQLTVAFDKDPPFIAQLDGAQGTHEIIVHLPAQSDDKPRVAAYALTATSADPSALGRTVPFVLYGLGAGYNAVGSVGIDQVNFVPGRVNATQSQQADYSFHSLFDFNKVSAEFMRLTRGPDREIIAERVANVDFDGISRGGQRSGRWNCHNGKKVSQGPHQLQVRAWRGLKDGGDWVAAMSRQSVFVD